MILLTSTNDSLELVTALAVATEWTAAYADHTTTTFTPGSGQGSVSTATDTTIVSAPGASTQRQIKLLTIRNAGTSNQTVTIQKDVSGTEYRMSPDVVLAPGEVLQFVDGQGFSVLDPFAASKVSADAEITNEVTVSSEAAETMIDQNRQIILLLSAITIQLGDMTGDMPNIAEAEDFALLENPLN